MKIKLTHIKIVILLSGFLFAGVCEMVPSSDPVTYEEVLGVYEANFEAGLVDKIELLPDSIYIRYFVSKDNHVYTDTGKWFYDHQKRPDFSMATFIGFKNRLTVDPQHPTCFSKESDAIYDSIPRMWATSFFKRGKNIRIPKGERSHAYIKKITK